MKALRPFVYSHDGVTPIHLEIGADASDVPADAVPGLLAEGYIGEGLETKVISGAPETGAAEKVDAYPHLTDAQEKALDQDGDDKPGGAPKGGNRKKPAA